jgi:putative endonuclease
MAHVYFLYSQNLNKFYIGSCLELQKRLNEHRLKIYPNCFTAKDDSWQLYFEIPNLNYEQARKIEKHIKNMKSSVYIKNLAIHTNMKKALIKKYA